MAAHLRPTAAIAADVLLPTDPGQALALAQRLLTKPLMANHSHGLWGYSGQTSQGRELTVQATGIGGPSTAVVLTELATHGARRAIRIGPATALVPDLGLGDVVILARALAEDGTAKALGAGLGAPDDRLTAALERDGHGGGGSRAVVSFDLLYDHAAAARRDGWVSAGAAVADLESAALVAAGRRLGLATAVALVVAETATGACDQALVEERLLSLGDRCTRAFAAVSTQSSAS